VIVLLHESNFNDILGGWQSGLLIMYIKSLSRVCLSASKRGVGPFLILSFCFEEYVLYEVLTP
jgi:hypothetical protein